ncbi:hypothetical protein L9F63_025685, partial [Diploptera punctata]
RRNCFITFDELFFPDAATFFFLFYPIIVSSNVILFIFLFVFFAILFFVLRQRFCMVVLIFYFLLKGVYYFARRIYIAMTMVFFWDISFFSSLGFVQNLARNWKGWLFGDRYRCLISLMTTIENKPLMSALGNTNKLLLSLNLYHFPYLVQIFV